MMTNGRIFQNFFTIVLVLSLCAVIFLLFKPSQLARRTFIIFLFVMLSFRIPLSFKSRCKNLLVLANSLEDRFQTKCRGVLYHVEYSFFFCIPVSFIFVTGVTIIFIAGSMNNFSNPQR